MQNFTIENYLDNIINGPTGFKTWEDREFVVHTDRDVAIAGFTIRCLANIHDPEAQKTLQAILDRRTILEEEKINTAWGNADFGNTPKKDLIKYSLLKYAAGYETGFTAKSILIQLQLLNPDLTLTKAGKEHLWEAFSHDNSF